MSNSQQPPPPEPQSIGCLYTILFILVLFTVLASWFAYLSNQGMLQVEEKMAGLRQEEFDAVRNGQTYASISDPLLLPMLSNDPLCVDHLESVFLAIDCSLELAAEIAKLKNLKEISFYGGSSAGHVLANAKHLPVESVGFDTVIIDEQLLRTIAELPHLKEVHLAWKPNAKDAELFDTLLPEVRLVTP